MLRITLSFISILLLLLILSCRSDARNSEQIVEPKEVPTKIVSAEINATNDSPPIEKVKDVEKPVLEKVSVAKETKAVIESQESKAIIVEKNEGINVIASRKQEKLDAPESKTILPNPETDAIVDPTLVEVIQEAPEVEAKSTVEIKEEVKKEATAVVASIHDNWDALLKKYVSASGDVDYKGFMSASKQLDAYLEVLSNNRPEDSDLSEEAMAFYINVYNAATVKLILDNYPVASIRDINNGKPWDKVWIKLGDKEFSLNNIEHDILRPRFKDERVHFAVNCASASCPKIANKAFYGSNLDAFLDKLTREFVNDGDLNTISTNSAQLSKLFQWYQGDFDNVIDFVNRYSNVKIKSSAKITYKDYKWDLNGK